MTPIAYLYAAIPLCGVFVVLFTVEQIVNGLRHGFVAADAGGAAARRERGVGEAV